MNSPAILQQGFQVEAITTDRLLDLYSRVSNSVSIYTSYGQAGYEEFMRFIRDGFLVVRFPFGIAIAKHGEYSHIIDAHLIIWSKEVFKQQELIVAAARKVMQETGATRVEAKFPSHIRALHAILRKAGFVEEGKLHKYMKVGVECFDVSVYAIVR